MVALSLRGHKDELLQMGVSRDQGGQGEETITKQRRG